MRVLLDECVSEGLRNYLAGHECQTARYAGFAGLENGRHHTRGRLTQLLSTRGLVGKKACGSASNPFRSKRRGGYALDEKVCSFRRTHLRSDFVKRLTFNSGSFHCISDGEDPKSKEIFLAPFQYLFLVYFSVEKLMH